MASFSPSATAQNPILTQPSIASPATFTVSLQVETSAGVSSSTTTKTVYQQSTLITKPLASDYFKTISIFLYSPPVPASVPSGVTTPCATVLNRSSPNNNLFFTDFQCVGSINKAGTLTFTAVDLGFSTAAERYLMTTAGVYVVVMIGYSVVWSGQILRATNSVTQTYSGTSGYASYSVECESDIGKMKTQGIANPGLSRVHRSNRIEPCTANSHRHKLERRGRSFDYLSGRNPDLLHDHVRRHVRPVYHTRQ